MNKEFNYNELQFRFMEQIVCNTSKDFELEMRKIFTIETICYIFGIDRNRYYYLVRTNNISNLYNKLRDEVLKQCIEEE